MLYRILRDLGSMDSARRQAAIRMARSLPWEDLEQFITFFDRGQDEARRSIVTLALILSIVGAGTTILFSHELVKRHLIVAAICICVALPAIAIAAYFGSRRRSGAGLAQVFKELDDPAFVAVGLGLLSDRHADHFSFRTDMFEAISRLLPEVTLEKCGDWTPEERYALSHGLNTVLPASAGGRDAMSHSPADYALYILKVLQRIGDSRELELVRLVSTIDPITEQHQKLREASVKCLKSIEKRLGDVGCETAETAEPVREPVRKRVIGIETDVAHLLKRRSGTRSVGPDGLG